MLRKLLVLGLVSVWLAACSDGGREDTGATPAKDWYAAWGTANYTTFPHGPLTQGDLGLNTGLFPGNEANAQTFRMMIHPTAGGDRLRLHFSNMFGDRPLVLENVSVAKRLLTTGPAIDAASSTPVFFDGEATVSIPVGEEIVSDAAEFAWTFGDDLAISFYAPEPTGPMSWHAEAFSTQYYSLPGVGDMTDDALGLGLLGIERGWFYLSGLDAQSDETANANYSIAIFGDSITDGFVSTPELNQRYPDFLARRLQDAGLNVGVVNSGINSNRVLDGGINEGAGGIERFDRDVLQRAGVRSVFVLLGTNDLSTGRTAGEVFSGLLELADQAHAANLCITVSTILPRNDPPIPFGWDILIEEPQRQALNQLILASSAFDAVADVAAAMENPLIPNQPFQPYFVEGLHPNSIGMQVLAEAIPLDHLLLPPDGVCNR